MPDNFISYLDFKCSEKYKNTFKIGFFYKYFGKEKSIKYEEDGDMQNNNQPNKISTQAIIAAVVPTFKTKKQILSVIRNFGPEVKHILVVDDCCPDKTGAYVQENISDNRVQIIYHDQNQGVGAATLTGYRRAISLGSDVIVKVDSDGQMNPSLIPYFIRPILNGEVDYVKGNRFYDIHAVQRMPKVRIFGNLVLSFFSKLSSGYWNIFDPTNGYTAISSSMAKLILKCKIENRYFFESDMLFRLGTFRAVVMDIPMVAVYEEEKSNLYINKILFPFFAKHVLKTFKRITYNYFIRDFSFVSLNLILGIFLFLFGFIYGLISWITFSAHGELASSGTVMLSALPIIVGIHFLTTFLNYDIMNVPKDPRSKYMA